MARSTHLVGAWPGLSAAHAMDIALTRLGPWLERMTDGEVGLRSEWVRPVAEGMRANPDVEMIRDGRYTGYEDTTVFKLREGRTLNPDTIDLGFRRAFEGSYPAFKELRRRHGREGLRFQVGVPSPVDLALVCFGPAGFTDPAIIQAFLQAELREIHEIVALADPEGVVFQLETIVAIPAATDQAMPQDHALEGGAESRVGQVAGLFAAVAQGAPPKTHFGMHLCLGDFNHEAFSHVGDAAPLVQIANAIVSRWPSDRPLDYVHLPFAAASDPPSLDPEFYAPLANLELPADVRLAAGFIHEHLDQDAHAQLLETIEGAAGREVDIAATCGLGRRPNDDEADDAMDKSRALLEAHA